MPVYTMALKEHINVKGLTPLDCIRFFSALHGYRTEDFLSKDESEKISIDEGCVNVMFVYTKEGCDIPREVSKGIREYVEIKHCAEPI